MTLHKKSGFLVDEVDVIESGDFQEKLAQLRTLHIKYEHDEHPIEMIDGPHCV